MVADTIKIKDRILLRRAIYDNDREALGRLHSIYYSCIKRYITSRINSIPDAEDLTQNLFFELCKGNGHYDGQRDAEAYLFGMARNFVAQYHRKKSKKAKTIHLDLVDEIAASNNVQQYQGPAEQVSQQKLKDIKDLIAQLPPKTREAVKLRFIDGLSSKEAAKRAGGCKIHTFYQRIYQAKKIIEKLKPGLNDKY